MLVSWGIGGVEGSVFLLNFLLRFSFLLLVSKFSSYLESLRL